MGNTSDLYRTDPELVEDIAETVDDEAPTCPICDGIHGYLCPIESPDPAYYADEMAAGR